MKRFYAQVATRAEAAGPPAGPAAGYAVLLDGRPVRTPARAPLLLPTAALAGAVAAEWRAQQATIDPRAMPLTGLANAAIDRVAPDRTAFAAPLLAYVDGDATCHRATDPAPLVAAERAAWDPLHGWARRRLDLALATAQGVAPARQPPDAIRRVAAMLEALDPFRLAALDPLIRIAGSALIGLAVLHAELDGEAAFRAGHVEELWQASMWGEDALAAQAREGRRQAMLAAALFLSLRAGD